MADVPVIRHKNRTGKDNPVSGAIHKETITFANGVTGTTYAASSSPPDGMNLELIAIDVHALGVAGDPQVTVGTSKAGTQIAASATLVTNLGELTLKSTAVTAGDTLDIRVINDGVADAWDSVSLTVYSYCSVPPDSVFLRGTGHF